MRILASLLLLSGTAGAACLPVSGDRILGMHLAMLDPAFAKLPAALTVGFAPQPGTPRVLTASEVGRIAQLHDVELEAASEMCFEIPLRRLSTDEVSQAMLRVLPPGARLEVLELPSGEIPA